VCDFCYKEAFFEGGRSFYTQSVDAALAEIDRLPGRHLYFLDDHLFGAPRFAAALFDGMRGMGRLWQAAGTVTSVLAPNLLEKAVACGPAQPVRRIRDARHRQPPRTAQASEPESQLRGRHQALHDLGVMINGSFVFGMDGDDESVFERTVEWAIEQGIETATFHILTPYPGTALHARMKVQQRITTEDWDLYDTRHPYFSRPECRPCRVGAWLPARVSRLLSMGVDRQRRSGRTTRQVHDCVTPPMPQAGRNSSRCGTG
jgi:radical SAM superfamily enzyme YgiQ (UPF0313 family)